MNTPTADQLALFKTVQTHGATDEETLAISGLTFFSVGLYHLYNITFLDAFLSKKEAEDFAEAAHRMNKSCPDFTRGGEERARWCVNEHIFDEKGIDDSFTTCSFQADEA